jgi:hypothetical protein
MSRPKGFKHSEATRLKMSLSAVGNKNGLGKVPTAEHREKIRQAKLGVPRPDMIGKTYVAGNTWSRGKVLTEATKKLISNAKIGKQLSFEHRAKLSASAHRGVEHHNWKGGLTSASRMERVKFRKTMQKQVFARDNYICQFCEAGGNLQVDHIKKWSDYPELRFDIDNCRTLCMACHYYITFKRVIPKGQVWGHNLNKLDRIRG